MIPEGLRRAGRAMGYLERRQEVVSHNLANASTPGFRGERVFAQVLEGLAPQAHARTDLRAGSLTPTGRPLDLALGSDGFLVVDTPAGERWVRGGSFSLDAEGRVVDGDGNPLLGENGVLVLPPGDVEVTPEGEIRVAGERVDVLRLERTAEPLLLEREGAGRFRPPEVVERVPAHEARVRSMHLEESNVEPVAALVEMIGIQRNYATLQRSVQVMDGVLGTIANDLGRLE